MTKEQWRIKRTLPYIGYSLANNTISWDAVEYIGEVYIRDLRALFRVGLKSGKYIEYNYPEFDLEVDYTETKRFFGLTKKVKIVDAQYYFDRNCDKMKGLQAIRNQALKAFFKYKYGTIKLKGLK